MKKRKQAINMGEFIGLVKAANIPGTGCWLDGLQNGYPRASWDLFRGQPLTMEAVSNLIEGVTLQAEKQIEGSHGASMEYYYEICVRWNGFKDEIRALAKECSAV
jgi:hypothetical protein